MLRADVWRMSAGTRNISGLSVMRRGYDRALRQAAAMANGQSAIAAKA